MNEDYFDWPTDSLPRVAGKLGRKAARHSLVSMRRALVTAKHLDALGDPPAASNDYVGAVTKAVGGDWRTFLNDRLGCCVEADTAHSLMLRTANAGKIVIPTDPDVLKLYETVGGYVPGDPSTDQGTSETVMCAYDESTGFLGHKSDATAFIDPANVKHVKWGVQLLGAARIGFRVPAYAMQQFNAGKPWDLDPSGDQKIEGGHDVPLVDYKGDNFLCVTWGRLQIVTRAFLNAYCDEVHGEVFPDWIRKQGESPSGSNLEALVADLKAIAA